MSYAEKAFAAEAIANMLHGGAGYADKKFDVARATSAVSRRE